jgi:hypothetical protein
LWFWLSRAGNPLNGTGGAGVSTSIVIRYKMFVAEG